MEMLLTGDFIDADRRWARGLVNRVACRTKLDAEVEKLDATHRRKAAGRGRDRQAAVLRQIESGIEDAYTLASEAMACNMMDEAALEGVQAFIEKRTPAWPRGR